jgi:tRNA(fMet)-specific endonuclease VapC
VSLFLLDTNICIALMKGEETAGWHQRSAGIENCFLSEIVVMELLYGVEYSLASKRDRNRASFDEFISIYEDFILPISPVIPEFARQKARLRALGKPVADFDLLIGCTAIVHGLALVTRNARHFAELPILALADWRER